MKPILRLLALLGALLQCSHLLAAETASSDSEFFQAIRQGDIKAVRQLLGAGVPLDLRDKAGNTPLHVAALRGDTPTVAELLRHGAPVNATNQAGATPLLYGAHNLGVVRELLRRGANPNLASTNAHTPLLAAVLRNDSHRIVRLLLEHGADVKVIKRAGQSMQAEGEAPLVLAIQGGDQRTIDLLIQHGATVNPTNGLSPLLSAALVGNLPTARRLLDLGANPDYEYDVAGHSLNMALVADHRPIARLLIEHGADPRLLAPEGYKTPPIVVSAYNDLGDASIARLLMERGVDVNAQIESGETALSWALKRGPHTPLVQFLRQAGATNAATPSRHKTVPARSIPSSTEARLAVTRDGVQRAIGLLEHSSTVFLDTGFVRDVARCTSCHQQSMPGVVLGWARERGFRLNDSDLFRLIDAQSRYLGENAEKARQLDEPVPNSPVTLGWSLQALHALGYAPDDVTEAMARFLVAIQRKDGSWPSFERRPPLEDGMLVGVALATRAVQLYPLPRRERESQESLRRGRNWFTQAEPRTQNERAFQLLGLRWSGESPERLGKYVKRLIAEQRPDGGWAQLPGLESDAWATGQALVALHDGGGAPTSHIVYQRGVEFLLRTQFDDGSWWVRSRTWPFQPHFDSQFPHGKDQWISAAGTAWATMALLLTIEPSVAPSTFPTAQTLLALADRSNSRPPASGTVSSEQVPSAGSVDFARDIKPFLERSCAGCHSGDKPKGGFRLDSREALLKAGQSGEAAVVSHHSEKSPLVRFISDEVEDLEMPPLGKRQKYPALTKDEIARLRTWLDQGASWAEGVTLNPATK